jgi:hypothetical protein
MSSFFLAGLAFVAGVVYSSFFEWALHRYILHSRRFLKSPHRAHQLEHHGIFRADATYFLTEGLHEKGDEKHLTFAWYHAPLLIALHVPLLALAWLYLGPWVAGGLLAAMVAYYGAYEYLHYCMHVPRKRWLERTWLFRAIQDHHRYHHVYYMKNLNVVLPLADFILRTRGAATASLYDKLESVRVRRHDRETGLLASEPVETLAAGVPETERVSP